LTAAISGTGESDMIDFDYGPIAVLIPISIAFLVPFIYSFFVDNYDKKNPQIRPPARTKTDH
jgi:hypothetical protein